jgi:hypothetical protein
MSPHQRHERLRLQLITTKMRLDWAMAEAKRNPTTGALTTFIKDSRQECRVLKRRLAEEWTKVKLIRSPKA